MSEAMKTVHFVWMLPEEKDSNRHIRNTLVSESKFCFGFNIIFFQGTQYWTEVGNLDAPNLVILFGSFYKPWLDIYTFVSKIRSYWQAYIVAWTTDDPYEFDSNYCLPSLVDFVFSNDRNTCHYYHAKNVGHLPLAASEFTEIDSFVKKKDWDFVFCGVGFPNRIQVLLGLQSFFKNYSTLIIGPGWSNEVLKGVFWKPAIAYEELLSIYRSTKIVLNLSRDFNLCNSIYEIVPSTPGPRTFEVAARGDFQLVFFDKPELYEYFSQPENEIVAFSSRVEFVELAQKYLENEELRYKVAKKTQQRVLNEHLYRHRLQTLFNKVFD